MSRLVPQTLRTIAGILAVAVYALPSTVGVLSVLGHSASHVVDEAVEQRRIAASLGLTHDAGATPTARATSRSERLIITDPVGVVHTHGGTTHAHGGVVGDLLTAAGTAEGQMSAAPIAPPNFGVHVPAPLPPGVTPFVASATAIRTEGTAPEPAHRAPQHRPPRA